MAKGMSRILIVLALAILLLPAPHNSKPATVQPGALLVTTRALPLSTNDPALRRVGAASGCAVRRLDVGAAHFLASVYLNAMIVQMRQRMTPART